MMKDEIKKACEVLQKLIPESGYTGEDAQTTEYDLLPNFGDVWDKDFDNSVESPFLKVMLNIQNAIKAYKIDPDIDQADALE